MKVPFSGLTLPSIFNNLSCVVVYLVVYSVMMANFPGTLMQSYNMTSISQTGGPYSWLSIMFGAMSVQMLHTTLICFAMAKDGASDLAKGAACLGNVFGFAMFILTDLYYIYVAKTWPSAIPMEGEYFNIFIWTVMVVINYMGWKSAGGEMPEGLVMPFGRPKWGLILGMANFLPYIVLAIFMPDMFVDMYSPGVVAGFPAQVRELIIMIATAMGRMMLANTVSTLLICEAGSESDLYRVQRAWVLMGMSFLALQGAIGIVFDSNGWEAPMKLVGWATNFAVIYYNAKTFADTPFKLEAYKKPKKN